MAWEHQLAAELKKRDNSTFNPWVTGKVVSADPLVITAYDGQVRLTSKELTVLQHVGELEEDDRVILLGEQSFVVLGVI